MKGFLNTWAGFSADLNFVLQLAMGGCLIIGALLAQAKHYTAHAICQTTVIILNLALIATIMGPAFEQQVVPRMPAHMTKLHYSIAALHGALGFATELLGLYILLVAGTNVLPPRFRFSRWKLLMRAELMLWVDSGYFGDRHLLRLVCRPKFALETRSQALASDSECLPDLPGPNLHTHAFPFSHNHADPC